jgi:hypothetical protein
MIDTYKSRVQGYLDSVLKLMLQAVSLNVIRTRFRNNTVKIRRITPHSLIFTEGRLRGHVSSIQVIEQVAYLRT